LPILSVVIPVYNREKLLSRAIASVLAQASDEIEIIIVDDGSAPPIELLSPYDREPRIRLLTHAANRGPAAARNTGMHAARGAWIAFLDSDDIWLPNTLQPRLRDAVIADRAGANPLLVHVAGFKLVRAATGKAEIRIPISSLDALDFASGCWFSPGSTALFRREPLLTRIGGQDESLRRFEDVDWFLRIALAGGGIVTDPLVAAEIEVGARPSPQNAERQGRIILEKFASLAGLQRRRHILRRLKAWIAFERGSALWHSRHYVPAFLSVVQSWWFAPRARLYVRKFWWS